MLLQNIIEKSGIPTVSMSLLMEITRKVEPPRVLDSIALSVIRWANRNNPSLQTSILMTALTLLSRDSPQSQSFSL